MKQECELVGIFPTAVCIVKRDPGLDSIEKKEIENIIEEGMYKNEGNYTSNNTYIFNNNDNLKNLKQFCEQQLKIYVKEVLDPKAELDFYITQAWINVTKPGGFHHDHYHPNSSISGVFYVATEEDDKITFGDPNLRIKQKMDMAVQEFNMWNSPTWFFETNNSELILFPSWLEHRVMPNKEATTDRISISFNTFVRGSFGSQIALTELILK